MGFPDSLLSNQWTDGEFLTAAKLSARIDAWLNALATRLLSIGGSQLMAQQTSGQTAWNGAAFVPVVNMTASIDPAAAFSSNAWTIPATGNYDVSAMVSIANGGTGRTRTGVGIGINGSVTPYIQNLAVGSATVGTATLTTIGVPFTLGQVVGLLAYHDASSPLATTVSTQTFSYLRISRVS